MSKRAPSHDTISEELIARFRRDDERNRELYSRLIAQHGNSTKALNWTSTASQQLRFRIIEEIGIGANHSVLDVGCGTGDFLDHLRSHGFQGSFHGLDLTPPMIESARLRFPGAAFDVVNLLEAKSRKTTTVEADFVVASGLFYYRSEEPERYLCEMVRCLFEACRVGTAFNSLSAWADLPPEGAEYRADPLHVLEFCRSITPFVTLRHDYHRGDFTIYMRRARAVADKRVWD